MDTQELKTWAQELGFCDAALCSAAPFDAQREAVLSQPPLSERKQLRFDPQADDAHMHSIAVLLWPYQPLELPQGRALFVDSYYQASNAAYHAAKALEERLKHAGHYAKANVSYPAKEAAARAGLGVIGDHSLLIHPVYGTRVVIILVATDMTAPEEAPAPRKECLHCGRCAVACPTGAIGQEGMNHPERCLRNFMMEGNVVPEEMRTLMGNHLIGCDICQRVCPMQKLETKESGSWQLEEFVSDDPVVFSESVKRLAQEIGRNMARPKRVRAQAALLCGCIGDERDLSTLKAWALSDFEAIRVHAQWAIEQIEAKRHQSCGSTRSVLDQSTQTGYNI